jgi:FtsH-binding integral membrane protein
MKPSVSEIAADAPYSPARYFGAPTEEKPAVMNIPIPNEPRNGREFVGVALLCGVALFAYLLATEGARDPSTFYQNEGFFAILGFLMLLLVSIVNCALSTCGLRSGLFLVLMVAVFGALTTSFVLLRLAADENKDVSVYLQISAVSTVAGAAFVGGSLIGIKC